MHTHKIRCCCCSIKEINLTRLLSTVFKQYFTETEHVKYAIYCSMCTNYSWGIMLLSDLISQLQQFCIVLDLSVQNLNYNHCGILFLNLLLASPTFTTHLCFFYFFQKQPSSLLRLGSHLLRKGESYWYDYRSIIS